MEPAFTSGHPPSGVAVTLMVPPEIASVRTRLLARNVEIWLIGSRANNTAKETSDWDFVVFGGREVLAALQRETRVPSLDFLVVVSADKYIRPWPRPEDGEPKRGNWRLWKWQKISEDQATYEATKWADEDEYPDISTKRALRVRRCQSAA
jgi:predicted nucleotidyltransferase